MRLWGGDAQAKTYRGKKWTTSQNLETGNGVTTKIMPSA